VLLTLEEKKEPYQTKLVDLSNKPDWFVRLRSSSPPLNVPHTLKPNAL
jgi:glutathione S-transferase